MEIAFHITTAALAASDEDPAIAKAFAFLMSSINTDHRRKPAGGWTPTFPRNDSEQRPSRWVVDVGPRKLIATSDVHQPVTEVGGRYEPCQPGDRCDICSRVHMDDMEFVTLMLPEDS